MLDPRTVFIGIPVYDKPEPEVMGMLTTYAGLYAGLSVKPGVSHVGLVRNLIAVEFLRSHCEWLVFLDADTVATRRDLELLLEPCDTSVEYCEPDSAEPDKEPRPTRAVIAQVVDQQPIDYGNKTAAAADVLVCSEYAYKDEALHPLRFGLGFTRIHRSVFETLQELKHDGGPTVEVQRHTLEQLERQLSGKTSNLGCSEWAGDTYTLIKQLVDTKEDKAGAPRLYQISHQGRMFYDFFPSGPILSQFVPCAEWKGEDHGFFTLCMLAGIVPRIETRTRVVHIGKKGYPYLGPDAGAGQ